MQSLIFVNDFRVPEYMTLDQRFRNFLKFLDLALILHTRQANEELYCL